MVSQNCPAVPQNLLQLRRKLRFTFIKIGGLSKCLNDSSDQSLNNTVYDDD